MQISEHPKFGKICTFLTNAGFYLTLREDNGEDEGILSNIGLMKKGDNIPAYLSSVIIGAPSKLPHAPTDLKENVVDTNTICLWGSSCKYFAVLVARIFNLGPELKFKWKFEDVPNELGFNEDLRKYWWDLDSSALPKPGYVDKDEPWKSYSEERIKLYPMGDIQGREITLSSGKTVRYQLLNTFGEKLILEKNRDSISSNDDFLARFLQWKDQTGTWSPVQMFNIFKRDELREIRQDIEKYDVRFEMICEIPHPNGKEPVMIPLLGLPDFFKPTEI